MNYINVGMFIIDNIHFQYNSMMYGLLLVSIAYIFEVSAFDYDNSLKDKLMKSAAIYAIVLNFKHIYLYSAPAFGILYVR